MKLTPGRFVLMHTKDWFGLAVRILGLVFLYHALNSLPLTIGMILGGGQAGFITVAQLIWQISIAIWLIRGASFLMHLAFRNE
jgi:hypothetical protein